MFYNEVRLNFNLLDKMNGTHKLSNALYTSSTSNIVLYLLISSSNFTTDSTTFKFVSIRCGVRLIAYGLLHSCDT